MLYGCYLLFAKRLLLRDAGRILLILTALQARGHYTRMPRNGPKNFARFMP